MPSTIARSSTHRVAEIRESAVRCRVYSSANDFHGRDCEPVAAWDDWVRHRHARLREHDDGHWSVDIDDNHWYELRPAAAETADAGAPVVAGPEDGVVARIDTPRVARARQRAVRCRLHTRDNNFLGVACSPADAWAEWDSNEFARLRVLDEGESWSIHIDDDRWYALYPAEMPLLDQPGRPPEPGPEIDPEILEAVLTELIGRDGAQQVFTELDTATARAKLDDPLHCVCGERDEPVTPDVVTCGMCGRSWCNRCHPTPAARCPSEYEHPEPQPAARLRWEAGPESGEVGVTDEQTATLVLDGEPLLGLNLEAGTVLTWPDGKTEHVIATFLRPKPRLQVVAADADVIALRPRTT